MNTIMNTTVNTIILYLNGLTLRQWQTAKAGSSQYSSLKEQKRELSSEGEAAFIYHLLSEAQS